MMLLLIEAYPAVAVTGTRALCCLLMLSAHLQALYFPIPMHHGPLN